MLNHTHNNNNIIKIIPQRHFEIHVFYYTSRSKSIGEGGNCTLLKIAARLRGPGNSDRKTVEMEYTEKNKLCVEQYEALIREKYKEPIDGKFEDATASIFEGLKQPEDEESSDDSELEPSG